MKKLFLILLIPIIGFAQSGKSNLTQQQKDSIGAIISDSLSNYSLSGNVAPALNYNRLNYKSVNNTSTKVLNIVGNSISEGVGSDDYFNNSYVGILKKRYKEYYGTTNEGYVNTDSTSLGKPFTVTLSGFSLYSKDGAYLGGSSTTSSTSGNYITYDYTGGSCYIVYKTVSGGGSFQVLVDDALQTTINTATGTASNFTISDKITIAEGTHTLKLLKTDNLPTTISGVYFTDDINGYMINNLSRGSLLFGEVSDNVLYEEAQANGLVVSLGVNDRSFSGNVDTMKAKLRRILGYAELNNATAIICDFMFTVAKSDPYKTGLRTVASEYPQFKFIDFADYLYAGDGLSQNISNDGLHPYPYGHRIIADILSQALGLPIPDSLNNENFTSNYSSLINNTTGYSNMSSGFGSMLNNTTGYTNTSYGIASLKNNTTGFGNTAFGMQSMIWNETGNSNVAYGNNALGLNISGSDNVGIGYWALYGSRTASNNIGIGSNALSNITSGNNNVGIGTNAIPVDSSGNYNVGIGPSVLNSLRSGSGNVAIGLYAGFNLVTGGGNVMIGNQAGFSETGDNKLYITNSSTATPLIYGDFSTSNLTINGSLTATGNLNINGDASITGNLSVNNLSVNGITANTMTINSDLIVNGNLYLPNLPTDSTTCSGGQIFDVGDGIVRRKVYQDSTKAYIARVLADGGTVINAPLLDDFIKNVMDNTYYDSLLCVIDANWGIKKDANNKVTKIYDLLNHRNFIQADTSKSPTWVASDQNGLAGLRFDGVDDIMVATYATTSVPQPFTLFYTVKSLKSDAYNGNFWDCADYRVITGITGGTSYIYNGTALADTSVITVNIPFIYAGVFNGASSQIYKNNTLKITGNAGTAGWYSPTADGFYLGSSATNAQSNIMIYNITMKTGIGNISNINTQLNSKYEVY